MLTRALGEVRVRGSSLEAAPETTPGPERKNRPVTHSYRLLGAAILTSDAACALLAQISAHIVVHGWVPPSTGAMLQVGITVVVWVGIFHAFGLYEIRRLSGFEEFRRVIAAACAATTLLLVIRASANATPQRRWLGLTWVLALGLELLVRRLWRWRVGHLRAKGQLLARTAILGTDSEALRLAAALDDRRLGFQLVGFVMTGSAFPGGPRVIGSLDALPEAIQSFGLDCLFVASGAVSTAEMTAIRAVATLHGVEMRVAASLGDVSVARLSVQSVDGVLALSLRPSRLGPRQALLKRMFDIGVGSVLVVVTLPLVIVVAVAVRLSSPGPVFFRQERVTKGGRIFEMLKFRTMTADGRANSELDLTRPFFKLVDDPRITSVGRLLRKWSLDELPQLWQVVRGDLSLVGPRPLPAVQVSENEEMLSPRHQVRAGLTGWWQVNGRSSVGPTEALRMDLYYIENWSLSLDLFILLKTFGTVLSRHGAG
jgi:exopolysaccharide biosynthesis polyprenyl glycosylphosphotransferase